MLVSRRKKGSHPGDCLGDRQDDGTTGCREQVWGRETGFAGDQYRETWRVSGGRPHQGSLTRGGEGWVLQL